jgi:uncharacterized protein YdaU (DUF1376 family)
MPPSQNKNHFAKQDGKLAAVLSAVIVAVVLAGLLIANLQSLMDWWRLRGYQPPAAISQLAAQDTMTPYARHLFYLNKPQLISSVSAFREDCPENEETIVLGCYHPGEGGIYLYKVKAADLQGVAEVTAAHEDLHAIYDRLSSKERQKVDKLLQNYYEHGLSSQRVKEEIKLYKKTEPHSVMNEMHSVFGTEVASLPAPLEQYYKQYFSDRSAIIAFSQQYEQAFTSRQDKIRAYVVRLSAMKQKIDSEESDLRSQQAALSATEDHLKSLLSGGQTSEYNAEIPAYNSQVNTYNAGVSSLKELISQYNQLVKVRNGVASELTTLDKALDTRLTPTHAN